MATAFRTATTARQRRVQAITRWAQPLLAWWQPGPRPVSSAPGPGARRAAAGQAQSRIQGR